MARKRYPPDDPREWLNRARSNLASGSSNHSGSMLSQYAFETRYPGRSPPVKPREYRRAVRIAESVLSWAERQIGKP